MGAFGAVIPITGLNFGFVGQVSRTGGGDPFIVSKQANAANAASIAFGDTVVVLPDSLGGTYKQFADWVANGGGLVLSVGTVNASPTLTPASATLSGLQVGMFVSGAGIAVGSYITAVNPAAGTVTISKNATATATVNLSFVTFGGIAVREVKTSLQYTSLPPVGTSVIGSYPAGTMCEALVRGSITVRILNGTPVQGGAVYIRAILNTGTYPNGIVGGLETIADGVNNILLPNFTFKTGVLDANGIAEVTILDRVGA
jgi:hypothetical protein